MGNLWRAWAALLLVAGSLSAAGCLPQEALGDGTHKVNPVGVYTDATLVDFLQMAFADVQACSNLSAGSFDDLSVVMMEPLFPCPWYETGCTGEFVIPNTVKLGSPLVWKHEILHFLLYVNTGNPDSTHDSLLFQDCT
ncbi:MAG: hypothetical protein OEW11_04160 [Nitrospirota bacterium]|nr:hypothetical protein [Nitrospirota bacterium]